MSQLESYSWRVEGIPAPKGSKSVSRGRMFETSKKLPAWDKALDAALGTGLDMIEGQVGARVVFYMPRPKYHYNKAGIVKPEYLDEPYTKKPDLDKLCRAVFDGLTRAGVIKDDSYITTYVARKKFIPDEGHSTGVQLSLYEVE